MREAPQLRWRWYRTAAGKAPVREFLDGLSDVDHAAIVAAMTEVKHEGLVVARRVVGDLWEIRAVGVKAHYRLIFSHEGRRGLLALDIYDKDTQRMPLNIRKRSEQRLQDWRSRTQD